MVVTQNFKFLYLLRVLKEQHGVAPFKCYICEKGFVRDVEMRIANSRQDVVSIEHPYLRDMKGKEREIWRQGERKNGAFYIVWRCPVVRSSAIVTRVSSGYRARESVSGFVRKTGVTGTCLESCESPSLFYEAAR